MSKFNCQKYDFSKISESIPELQDTHFELYIDTRNIDEIVAILENEPKKTRRILYQISTGHYSDELYKKLTGYDSLTQFVYKGKNNFRIYCKEFKNGKKKIVLIIGMHKKSFNVKKADKKYLNQISNNTYEFNE